MVGGVAIAVLLAGPGLVGVDVDSLGASVSMAAPPGADGGCDFDGDGYDDLAIGVPDEDAYPAPWEDTGAVQVLYGSAVGATAERSQWWDWESPGSPLFGVDGERFGEALVCADFDADGFDDLVIGVLTRSWAGKVQVLYGSAVGLTADRSQWWDQDSPGVLGGLEGGDTFGWSLASGDFDGDGFADLAIGVPREDLGAPRIGWAGAVQVLYGSAVGLTADRNQWWDQGQPGILGAPERGDRFGWVLAAGDLNGDGFDDLAIGNPYEHFIDIHVGAVQVLYGSAVGLTAAGNQWWFQDTPGVLGANEESDLFGRQLVIADFDADGFADLAIGVSSEDLGVIRNAGAVQVLYGSAAGLSADRNQWWDQGQPGVLGGRENSDAFGASLAAGDFNGDGFADLAIGVPGEALGEPSIHAAGAVQVLYGSAVGLTADRNQWWDQGQPGILGGRELADRFGQSVAAGDLDGDGLDELLIGVPNEDLGTVAVDAGALQAIPGSASGLTADGNQWWSQSTPGILGGAEVGDQFGRVLAS